MGRWSLDDIPWDRFDPSLVDPDIVPVIKAASLVEANADDYSRYLCNVFRDDERAKMAVRGWAAEERQHGAALARWAALADPGFDFERSFRRFTEGFSLPLTATESVRGSRVGELIARCMVETGTSSFYKVLAEATEEPVLKAVCRHIEEDELAHYALFHRHLDRYLARERLGFWARLRVALSRIAESEDDELAYAYYAANAGEEPYDRRRSAAAYARRTLRYVAPDQFERSVGMILQAIGLKRGAAGLRRAVSRLVWAGLRARFYLLALRTGATAG